MALFFTVAGIKLSTAFTIVKIYIICFQIQYAELFHEAMKEKGPDRVNGGMNGRPFLPLLHVNLNKGAPDRFLTQMGTFAF